MDHSSKNKRRSLMIKVLETWRYFITKGLINKIRLLWIEYAPTWMRPHLYFHLYRLIFLSPSKNKKILGIWDYKVMPWSVGDVLLFIEALSCLKIKTEASKVDIAIIYDKENPAGNRKHIMPNVSSNNANNYIIDFFLPLFRLSPYLGNIFLFSNRRELELFFKQNIKSYNSYPNIKEYSSEYLNYLSFKNQPHKIIKSFNKKYNYLPDFFYSQNDIDQANIFFKNNLKGKTIPVSLSFKLTNHDTTRNADLKEWCKFIEKCNINHPEICFVIVGLRDEIVPEMQKWNNVVFAKEFSTTIVEDLALIQFSIMYMATTSGINTSAHFSNLPYLIFRYPNESINILSSENTKVPYYQKKQQQNIKFNENAELLYDEFIKIYSQLDKKEYLKKITKANNISGHPASIVENKK